MLGGKKLKEKMTMDDLRKGMADPDLFDEDKEQKKEEEKKEQKDPWQKKYDKMQDKIWDELKIEDGQLLDGLKCLNFKIHLLDADLVKVLKKKK